MQDKLNLVSQCMPFISHASGISTQMLYKMPVLKLYGLLAEHGSKLMVRLREIEASGKDVENEICFAEALAVVPLAQIFAPDVLKLVGQKLKVAA